MTGSLSALEHCCIPLHFNLGSRETILKVDRLIALNTNVPKSPAILFAESRQWLLGDSSTHVLCSKLCGLVFTLNNNALRSPSILFAGNRRWLLGDSPTHAQVLWEEGTGGTLGGFLMLSPSSEGHL